MKRTASFGTKTRLALAITMLAVLSACGGGGGGGGGGDGATLLDLTVANRDAVAHASATSVLAMDAWTLALAPIIMNAGGLAGGRELPKVVITDPPYACPLGGTFTLTLNDHNNNGQWDPSEVLTVAYNGCRVTTSDILGGSASITLVGSTSASASLKVSMAQLSDLSTDGRHDMTLSGAIGVDIATSPSSSRIVATASGPVTVTIRTHEFSDSVTLQPGFVKDRAYDAAADLVTATLRGTIQSGTLGAGVAVSTDSPLTSSSTATYPSAGTLRITGSKGMMLMTAGSTNVAIDLDYNDDGLVESSSKPTWDWLL